MPTEGKCSCCSCHGENDMEWFKHSTKEDSDVFDAVDQFGIGAYAIWYMVLELYAEKYNDTDNDGFLVVSNGFLKRRLLYDQLDRKDKITDVLNFFASRGRIEYADKDGFHHIKVNDFEELASNWQRRKMREKEGPPPEAPLEGGTEAPPSRKKEGKEKKEKKEEKEGTIVSQVIDHLNEVGKFSYRPSSREAQKYIKGRAQEGATFEDFKVVIEFKVKEWGSDPKMAQYLRPSTLFNSEKFWGYLNTAKMKVVTTKPTAGYRGSGVAI